MNRLIGILVMAVLISVSGELSLAFTAEKDVPIGNTLNPKILTTYPIPGIFSYGGSLSLQNDRYLWISGTETTINKDGKRDYKNHLAVFDIANPAAPQLLAIHQIPHLTGRPVFFDHYAYCFYNDTKGQKNPAKIKNRYGVYIYDVTDPQNIKLVKTIGKMFENFPSFVFVHDDYMYAPSWVPKRSDEMINQSTINKFSLKDPTNPKIVFPLKGMDGKSENFDGIPTEMAFRDNCIYVNAGKIIYVFDSENDKLLASHEGSLMDFTDICLTEEYMSEDQTFLLATGRTPNLFYPGEGSNFRNWSYQNGIVRISQFNYESLPNMALGQSAGSVRIPINPRYISSKGVLVYVIGSEIVEEEPSAYPSPRPDKFSKMLVVDLSYSDDPKFAGSLGFDGQIIDWVTRGNIAYLICLKNEGKGAERKNHSTLLTVELPVKEGVFKSHPVPMSDIYPGYKEPVTKPKSITSALREEINKPTGDLTSADFKDLKSLDVENKHITDLTGIELCNNLEEINLKYNKISDITPLAGLPNLRKLNLYYNKVKNIDILPKLKNLEELNISDNQISDITPLPALQKLTHLSISRTLDLDLTPISKLNRLTELNLNSDSIFRPPSLSGLTDLKTLNLTGNDIYYLDFIDDLPSGLEELNLSYNNIKDISKLGQLVGLKKLYLENNNITDLSPIKNLTNLEELTISGNKRLSDINALSGLTNLKKLNLSEIDIEDINALRNLANLEELDLSHINYPIRKISDIKPLENLKNLKVLNMEQNNVKNIKPLTNLSKLTQLSLKENKVENIKPLENLKGLEKLNLQNNKIKDVHPLTSLLTGLMVLDISLNPIKDVKPWLGLDRKNINSSLVLILPNKSIPQEQIEKLRKIVVIAPSPNEYYTVMNLYTLAESEKEYFNANGKYASPDELNNSGFLYTPPPVPNPDVYPHYQIVKFDTSKDSFTVIATPKDEKGNEDSRIFAISEDGNIREWIGDKKSFDMSVPLTDDAKWSVWPSRSALSVGLASCGPGG